jgi:hypothetical protein
LAALRDEQDASAAFTATVSEMDAKAIISMCLAFLRVERVVLVFME